MLLDSHNWNASLEDTGLFLGDALDSIAQLSLMVDTQAGYADNFRLNNVGAVQPAAQPGLDYCDISLGVHKIHKCQRSHNLKEGRRVGLGYLLNRGINPVQKP
ncbi:hypothetical protein ES703_119648 [subsurface metagenome]